MKALFIAICAIMLGVPSVKAQTPNSWELKKSYPDSPGISLFSFVINGKAYMGTGYNSITCSNAFWEYDPAADQWTRKADYPSMRSGVVAFAVNGKGYAGFGGNCSLSPVYEFYEYNPSNDTWQMMWPSGSTITPGLWSYGCSVGDYGYIFGGYYNISLKTLLQYDPQQNILVQKASIPGPPRNNAFGFTIDKKIYIGAGNNDTNNLNDFWVYDTDANSWKQLTNYPGIPMHGATAFALNGRGYVFGGTDNNSVLDNLWEYNPADNSWTLRKSAPEKKCYLTGFAVHDSGYIVCGQNEKLTYTRTMYQYHAPNVGVSATNRPNVVLYPNPVQNNITVSGLQADKVNFRITDLTGKVIQTGTKELLNSFFTLQPNLKNGMYCIDISANGGEHTVLRFWVEP